MDAKNISEVFAQIKPSADLKCLFEIEILVEKYPNKKLQQI